MSNVPTYLRLMASVWIAIRLQALSATLTFLLSVLGTLTDPNTSTGALFGVALTYALNFSSQLNLLLFASSQLENEFNSVERLTVYSEQLPEEAERVRGSDSAVEGWPTGGSVEFEDVRLCYKSRPSAMILDGITFKVLAGEKVGVVGRTGSGKSTLLSALYRIVELSSGIVRIDGVDISTLGLDLLRKSIQIIPQDAVLFSGTIRDNMDVESKFSDQEVWDVLETIGLKEYVSSLSDRLHSAVLENGGNLSVGQRQLVCLGRAILQKPLILIMDEVPAF